MLIINVILQLSFNYLNFGQTDSVSHYTIHRCQVLARYKEGIKRGFETKFSNGRTEGINNRIKTIKRVAYGYRYFTAFKTRIYLIIGHQIQTN
ncbi:transposase (plasmid) [Limosilactobacillus reuteri]|uniref:transposase n=1 Tax=Limosilactobacillus reuteri TaxID=1598 RepID=UPI00386C8F46